MRAETGGPRKPRPRIAAAPQQTLALSPSAIAPKVHWIRHEKVILDFDLAALCGVETRALKQAVRRNRGRFPADSLFVLTTDETDALVSQSVIPGQGKFGGAAPYAFTEQGVAMLSSVLRSTRAVQVNIPILRNDRRESGAPNRRCRL